MLCQILSAEYVGLIDLCTKQVVSAAILSQVLCLVSQECYEEHSGMHKTKDAFFVATKFLFVFYCVLSMCRGFNITFLQQIQHPLIQNGAIFISAGPVCLLGEGQ